MRNETTVTDEDDSRNLTDLDGLITALIDFACLIVNPFALGQITGTAVATLQQRGNQYLRAEHILIFDKPRTWVFRELYELGKKDPDFMHNAPHNAQIARPDEVRAARQPVLRWQKD